MSEYDSKTEATLKTFSQFLSGSAADVLQSNRQRQFSKYVRAQGAGVESVDTHCERVTVQTVSGKQQNKEEQMQTYIGTKTIRAMQMKRGEYNKLRGWEIPSDENPEDDGYLVEYLDGGKQNHPDFTGYISWSPKDVFERAYKVAETFLDRMKIESEDLDSKLKNLSEFLLSDRVKELPETYIAEMHLQKTAMQEYYDVLNRRISCADPSKCNSCA